MIAEIATLGMWRYTQVQRPATLPMKKRTLSFFSPTQNRTQSPHFPMSHVGLCAARRPIFYVRRRTLRETEPTEAPCPVRARPLPHRQCIPSSSRICRMILNAHACVCFSVVSADEAVPSQGPQGRRPRAGTRLCGLRSGLVHQPRRRMHAVLVDGEGGMRRAAVRRTAMLNSLLSHVNPRPRVKGFEGIAPLLCPCCVEDVTGTAGPALAGNVQHRSCCT